MTKKTRLQRAHVARSTHQVIFTQLYVVFSMPGHWREPCEVTAGRVKKVPNWAALMGGCADALKHLKMNCFPLLSRLTTGFCVSSQSHHLHSPFRSGQPAPSVAKTMRSARRLSLLLSYESAQVRVNWRNAFETPTSMSCRRRGRRRAPVSMQQSSAKVHVHTDTCSKFSKKGNPTSQNPNASASESDLLIRILIRLRSGTSRTCQTDSLSSPRWPRTTAFPNQSAGGRDRRCPGDFCSPDRCKQSTVARGVFLVPEMEVFGFC